MLSVIGVLGVLSVLSVQEVEVEVESTVLCCHASWYAHVCVSSESVAVTARPID